MKRSLFRVEVALMVEPLYQVKVTCALCETEFETSRVRPSFKKAVKTDSDFCIHYKDINPDYYIVRVCPNCGYASTENFSERLTPQQKKAFQEKVSANWAQRDYGGERTWEDALNAYKLVLLSAQMKEEKERVIAGLLHHIAWLYREKGDGQQEARFLQFALDAYIRVYETEGGDVNNAKLMYLIGELSRRLKHYREAVRWFSRVINDKRIMDADMIRRSREQWAETRENMLAERLELLRK